MGGSEFVAGLVGVAIGALGAWGIMLHQLREERRDRRKAVVRAAWEKFDHACRLELKGHRIEPDRMALLDNLLAALRVAGPSDRVREIAEDVRRRLTKRSDMDRGTWPGFLSDRPVPADVVSAREAYAAASTGLAESLRELELVVGEETREG